MVRCLPVLLFGVGNLSSAQMRYAAVPRETVCTENFTPWTKLLPCGISVREPDIYLVAKLFSTYRRNEAKWLWVELITLSEHVQ